MLVAIIADTHFGGRGDHISIADHMKDFFTTTFFPVLRERGIKIVIHCGDVFDRRKYINFVTLKTFQDSFFGPLAEEEFEWHVIPGNHDTPYKNLTSINSVDILLKQFTNVHIYNDPTDANIGGMDFLFVPWISAENQAECIEAINTSQSQTLIGHLEINGFEVHTGTVCDHGMDRRQFSRYDLVLSGHFHKRSTSGNITYVGTPYQMNWGDAGFIKGFHILDTETGELEFIPNPDVLFVPINYDDSNLAGETYAIDSFLQDVKVNGKFVRVNVFAKTDLYLFDRLIEKLEQLGAASVQIVDRTRSIDIIDGEESSFEGSEDTPTMITKYINQLDLTAHSFDHDSLLKLFLDAYTVAVSTSFIPTGE